MNPRRKPKRARRVLSVADIIRVADSVNCKSKRCPTVGNGPIYCGWQIVQTVRHFVREVHRARSEGRRGA